MPDVDKFASRFVDSLTKVSDQQKDVLGRFISDSFTSHAERLEKKQAETVKNTIVEQFKTELDERRNAPQTKQQR